MKLEIMLQTLREWFGVEPPPVPPIPDVTVTPLAERRLIEERLSRQQAVLAELLAAASLDEMRSRSPYTDG